MNRINFNLKNKISLSYHMKDMFYLSLRNKTNVDFETSFCV
jgi:hypothetical protein